jgi:uncharacterized protein YecE (DUF72 family)
MTGSIRIGTAGWSIPRQIADAFPAEGTGLERYAARFDAAEINTSFYRPHRRATYERWAASVPADFRFAVKLPKAVTHVGKLVDCAPELSRFAGEIAGLGEKRGPVLVQLPPKLEFDAGIAAAFFALATATLGGAIVCEPRHPSWFEPTADNLLAEHLIARVAADPARVPAAAMPGGWHGLVYVRLHGSPRMYWSGYEAEALGRWAASLPRDVPAWVIFDNTGSGRAAADALAFQPLVAPACPPRPRR